MHICAHIQRSALSKSARRDTSKRWLPCDYVGGQIEIHWHFDSSLVLEITPARCLCEEAPIRHRIPWAACQLIIQPLNVNHMWQAGSLRCSRACTHRRNVNAMFSRRRRRPSVMRSVNSISSARPAARADLRFRFRSAHGRRCRLLRERWRGPVMCQSRGAVGRMPPSHRGQRLTLYFF